MSTKMNFDTHFVSRLSYTLASQRTSTSAGRPRKKAAAAAGAPVAARPQETRSEPRPAQRQARGLPARQRRAAPQCTRRRVRTAQQRRRPVGRLRVFSAQHDLLFVHEEPNQVLRQCPARKRWLPQRARVRSSCWSCATSKPWWRCVATHECAKIELRRLVLSFRVRTTDHKGLI